MGWLDFFSLFPFHYDHFSTLSLGIKVSGFQYKLCVSLQVDCFDNCSAAIFVSVTLSSVMDLEEILKFASEERQLCKKRLRRGVCSGHGNVGF